MARSLRSGAASLAPVPSACPLPAPRALTLPSPLTGSRNARIRPPARTESTAAVICKRIHFHMTSAREYAAESRRASPVTEMINSACGGHCDAPGGCGGARGAAIVVSARSRRPASGRSESAPLRFWPQLNAADRYKLIRQF